MHPKSFKEVHTKAIKSVKNFGKIDQITPYKLAIVRQKQEIFSA